MWFLRNNVFFSKCYQNIDVQSTITYLPNCHLAVSTLKRGLLMFKKNWPHPLIWYPAPVYLIFESIFPWWNLPWVFTLLHIDIFLNIFLHLSLWGNYGHLRWHKALWRIKFASFPQFSSGFYLKGIMPKIRTILQFHWLSIASALFWFFHQPEPQ